MEPTYFAQYRGFDLQCSPQRLDSGIFAPRLVVCDSNQALSLEIPLAMPIEPIANPTTAAHLAFAHGRHWVDSGMAAGEFSVAPVPVAQGATALLTR